MLRKKAQANHLVSIRMVEGERRREEERYWDENESGVGNGCEFGEEMGLRYKVLPSGRDRGQEDVLASGRDGLRNYCSLSQQYKRNEQKIQRLSSKLQELYQHYQKQSERYASKKAQLLKIAQIQRQNTQLQQDIRKVRELLQGSLLESQRQRLQTYFSPS